MIGILIIVSICILVLSLILIFYNQIVLFIEKIFFKTIVGHKVYQIAKNNNFYLLNKVALPIEDKIIHFDHLIFGDKYIYCIGVKHYPYAISGKYTDASWFQYDKNNKFVYVKNPMLLHRERVNYFASKITSDKEMFVATIIINDSCLIDNIDGSNKNNIILNLNELEKTIKSYEADPNVYPIEPIRLHQLVLDVYKNGTLKK